MSAPQPSQPNGAMRQPAKRANPLRPNSRPAKQVQKVRPKPATGAAPNAPNTGTASSSNTKGKPSGQQRQLHDGWMDPPPPGCTDIPIITTKKALLESTRFHAMKFLQAKVNDKRIDPTDQEAFARPVTLHRRDPRQPPPGRTQKVEEEQPEAPTVDEAEAERLAHIKAEKEAQKAADQAKIAPVMKDNVPKQKKKPKEEKTSFYKAPKSEAARKEAEVRYEEALPWHLEDADGNNVWVGSYVGALSEHQVAFVIEQSVFRMVPLEKWYNFRAKASFNAYTIEEAEAMMKRKVQPGRWEKRAEEIKMREAALTGSRSGMMVKTESSTFRQASRAEKMDHDDLDFSGDEFQDDDEAHTFEKVEDDESKESKDRIRREQLGANLFGQADEQEIDKELQAELREEAERKKYGKKTRKMLVRRDREHQYESDKSHSDNEYESSSESSDEEEFEEKNEEEAKDQETKDTETKATEEKDKVKLGDSKTSTPQKKLPDHTRKPKNIKRAGSPAYSDSSGNESGSKKLKKKNQKLSVDSRSGTPVPGGVKKRKSALGAGSGSDGEATAGEMSDGAGPKKKIRIGSGRGSPAASRAGSPNPAASPASPVDTPAISAQEILDKVPAEGILISELIKPFTARMGDRPGQMRRSDWIKIVKQFCEYGPDKLLRPKK